MPSHDNFPALFSGGISRSLAGVKLRPALLHWLALALLSAGLGRVRAAAPVVSNVRAAQRAGTPWVDVYYDLADADRSALTVQNLFVADALLGRVTCRTFSPNI